MLATIIGPRKLVAILSVPIGPIVRAATAKIMEIVWVTFFCGQKCVNTSNSLERRFQRQSDEQCSEGEICCSFRCVSAPSRSGCDWEKGDQCSVGQRCCGENAWTLQNALDVLVIETNIALMVKFVAILNASTG